MYNKYSHNARKLSALLLALALLMAACTAGPSGGGETTTKAPETDAATQGELAWAYQLKAADDWETNVSAPVLVSNDSFTEDDIYIAAGSELLRIGPDGTKKDNLALDAPIDFTCRPAEGEGMLYVPLSGGRLQAVDPATMKSRWTTAALPEHNEMAHQAMTSVVVADGLIYYGTACADWERSYYGAYICVNEQGEEQWRLVDENAGFYNSGALGYGSNLLVAGDSGVLYSLDMATGVEVDSLDLGAPLRSGLDIGNSVVCAATADGVLNAVTMNPADGTFGELRTCKFADSSTSSPYIYDGKAYVGGGMEDGKGVLAVIDLAEMTVEPIVAPAPVQGSPLVFASVETGELQAVYFTANAEPGALYVWRDGEVSAYYTPETADQNYCISTPVIGPDGLIHYTNDSGKLFAVTPHIDNTSPTEKEVTLSIECAAAVAYGNDLAVEQYPDGTVLSLWETQIEEGESVLVLLQRTGLPVETASSALGVYVSGIGGLLAGKCGSGSGWVYEVNGEQILDSCDKYALKDGDNVVWKYVT